MAKRGRILIVSGLLLIAAALFLAAYDLIEDQRAGRTADTTVGTLEDRIDALPLDPLGDAPTIPDYVLDPSREMPVETIDGVDYIGVLSIPALALELPIVSEWSYPALRLAPCRYEGSAYTGDLVIAGHNYRTHFGKLKRLHTGDMVYVTDVDGNRFAYAVAGLETLAPAPVEAVSEGGWALTLFTCTLGGQSRLTVRCDAVAAG